VGGAERGPGEVEEADCFEGDEEEEPPEADFGGEGDAGAAAGVEMVDGGQIREVREDVANENPGGIVRYEGVAGSGGGRTG
jgi:hypothetical protein